jgi:hypothetical protein
MCSANGVKEKLIKSVTGQVLREATNFLPRINARRILKWGLRKEGVRVRLNLFPL